MGTQIEYYGYIEILVKKRRSVRLRERKGIWKGMG